MSSFNMSNINEALIGIDFNHTVNAFVIRDKLMNIDPNQHVIHCLEKLGYYNINMPQLIQKFLIDQTSKKILMEINDNFDSPYRYKSFEIVMEEIKNSDVFMNYMNSLNKRISRAFELSVFLKNPNMEKFYSSLTLEELNYLGY